MGGEGGAFNVCSYFFFCIFLLKYHFPKKHGIFPKNSLIFHKIPLIFPKIISFSGKVWEKACRKMRAFSCPFVNIMRFFLDFSLLSV